MDSENRIIIREWTENDFSTVRKILLLTWKDAYHFIPDKDLVKHLDTFYSQTALSNLYNDYYTEGYIAEIFNKPAGWMRIFGDHKNRKFFISSLYILPEFQGLGIGKKLLFKAETIALDLKLDKIWLGVMKDNVTALEWYKKLGFEFVQEEPFKMGDTEVIHLIGYKIIA